MKEVILQLPKGTEGFFINILVSSGMKMSMAVKAVDTEMLNQNKPIKVEIPDEEI